MKKQKSLVIHALLEEELATVKAIWTSEASTRRVDSLILVWVKYEKQLRRLFCYLVFKHPHIMQDKSKNDEVVAILVKNRDLYPGTFIKAIDALGATSVESLVGSRFKVLNHEIARIKDYRNKLMHGQNTGLKLSSSKLENDVLLIVEWISELAKGAHAAFGYDGLERNTGLTANRRLEAIIEKYPFSTIEEFEKWLTGITKKPKN